MSAELGPGGLSRTNIYSAASHGLACSGASLSSWWLARLSPAERSLELWGQETQHMLWDGQEEGQVQNVEGRTNRQEFYCVS